MRICIDGKELNIASETLVTDIMLCKELFDVTYDFENNKLILKEIIK